MSFSERLRQGLTALRLLLIVGIGIKRWLVVLGVATTALGIGMVNFAAWLVLNNYMERPLFDLLTLGFLPTGARIGLLLLIGGVLLFVSLAKLGRTLVQPFRRPGERISEMLVHYSKRNRGPKVVAIGGGTGMPGLLRGLKSHTSNITAIVTVADDGGSSGRLRREYGLLPPGDFRNNIAALARDEALMTQLIQYRFGESVSAESKSELGGHAFGNLLIAALVGITGSFDQALLTIDRVLAMRGKVVPSTLKNVTLVAEVLANGETRRIVGESAIPKAGGRIQRVGLEPERIRAYPPAVRAILQADVVIMGPGSLFTSVLPNVLVPDLARALAASRAKKVYVCNVAEQPGETDGFAVSDHVKAIVAHSSAECIDYVLANDNLSIDPTTGGGNTIFVQPDAVDAAEVITTDLLDEHRPWRHDSTKVAEAVIALTTRSS